MTKYIHFVLHFCLILFVFLLVACQPNQQDIQVTIENKLAYAVTATMSSYPTQTSYPTATPYPTQISLNTNTPYATQQTLATATYYPTATTYPTHTPLPSKTPTPILPTSPPTSVNSPNSTNGSSSPLEKQAALLEQMNIQHKLLSEFQGLASSFQDNPDCNRIIELYNGVVNLPEMDVAGTNEAVQQAYIAYRTAIEHFTMPETIPGDLVSDCKTQPDNVKNISQNQLNLISLYTGQSINRMHNAWYDIGGR